MKVVRIDEIPRHLRTQQQRWIILIGPAVKLVIGVVLIIDPDKIVGFIAKYDDWLNIYVNHIAEHIQQMQATYDAWVAEQKGQSPDPEKSLFKFSK